MANYDVNTHRYVQPYRAGDGSWKLVVNNCDYLPEIPFFVNIGREGPNGKILYHPEERMMPGYPETFASYQWSIKESGRGFSDSKQLPVPPQPDTAITEVHEEYYLPCRQLFTIPGTGRYEITLSIRLKDGSQLSYVQTKEIPKHSLIVALGDSLSSGQGNPYRNGVANRDWMEEVLGRDACSDVTYRHIFDTSINMKRPPLWAVEPLAYRDITSGPARASQRLASQNTLVTYVTIATSGAEIDKGLLNPQHSSWQSEGQVEELLKFVGRNPIDALIISIGANDIGFSGSLEALAKYPNLANYTKSRVENEVSAAIKKLPGKFAALNNRLKTSKLNYRKVYLLEYPVSQFDKADGSVGEGCGIFNSGAIGKVSVGDAQYLKDTGKHLNRILRGTAEQYDWVYVEGIADAFATHGYCTAERYYVSAQESCYQQGDWNGMMHPNSAGHGVYAERIHKTIIAQTPLAESVRPIAEVGRPQRRRKTTP